MLLGLNSLNNSSAASGNINITKSKLNKFLNFEKAKKITSPLKKIKKIDISSIISPINNNSNGINTFNKT